MDPERVEPLDELFYRDPQWIAEHGQYLHENNVLFYFAQSPFFDRQSNNNSVFLQAISDPRFESWLQTRENFESQLRRIAGTEYIVTHDPIATETRYKDGELSNIWVIQKQSRRKRLGQDDEVTPRALYYIVGDSIYQAPSVAKLIGNRMLSAVTSLNKLLSIANPLPVFSAPYGHEYLPRLPNAPSTKHQGSLRSSKESTPITDARSKSTAEPVKSALTQESTDAEDTQLFVDALHLSRRFGKEYMDDTPLVGEPGAFRISRVKDSVAPKATKPSDQQVSIEAKEKEPSTTVPPPPIQTDIPHADAKKTPKGGERSPTTPGGREKPKRRKSRPTPTPVET